MLVGKEIPIYVDGQQIRDWLYVDDHNRGIDLILRNGRVGETYNIGGNNEQTNMNLVKQLCSEMDSRFQEISWILHKSLITHVTDHPGHDRRYLVDTHKITSELSYQPLETFETGMRKTMEWYLDKLDTLGSESVSLWRTLNTETRFKWIIMKIDISK